MPKYPTGARWLFLAVVVIAAVAVWWRHDNAPADGVALRVQTIRQLPRALPMARSATSSATKPNADAFALFTYVQPENAAQLTAALPAPARQIHYVRINSALATGKLSPFWQRAGAGRVELPLPDGGTLAVVIDGSEMLGPDRFTSSGRLEGRPLGRAVFAWHAGFLHASVEDPVLGSFALRAATAELAQFYRVDPELVAPCGGERRPSAAERRRAAGLNTPAAAGGAATAASTAAARAEVHVMMAYTQAVLPTLQGAARAAALQSAFDLAIAKVNNAFEASLIAARVKLVRIAETTYDENASGPAQLQDDALTALYGVGDGKMDELHAARDAAGADVVCLALNRRDSASSGLSFLLADPGDSDNARFAFSVVHYGSITGTNVVPHELGHLFGCAHDRGNALSAGAFGYSYGYRFFGADGRQYRDIMSYPPGTELSYFSNPNVDLPSPISARLGISAGLPNESNTALTIERTALATSIYRTASQGPNAGSLINVATRAFVGTGDQVLIGGFVLSGSQPTRMLVRAAGPALARFGVAGALADPALALFSPAGLVVENDNWSSPTDASRAAAPAEISDTAAGVGAFPFASSSADAAVLVTLPPGAYTAVIAGVSGKTGYGLIEAYQVDREYGRVVNLATRGHAGRDGRELFGGFVVHGEPGTTKRILVRVLGPSLARAPFHLPATLEDPELEIWDASGDVLVKNDDWSSGAEGGASTENDFRPLVATYGEREIFATGHAPANRREPCVLVELPPGNYSVIARPFERRSTNPLRDQPAVPGVGVIEVYELGR